MPWAIKQTAGRGFQIRDEHNVVIATIHDNPGMRATAALVAAAPDLARIAAEFIDTEHGPINDEYYLRQARVGLDLEVIVSQIDSIKNGIS